MISNAFQMYIFLFFLSLNRLIVIALHIVMDALRVCSHCKFQANRLIVQRKEFYYLIGRNFVGGKFRRQKIFVGKNFRHLLKISSLFPTKFLPIRYFLKYAEMHVIRSSQSSLRLCFPGFPWFGKLKC